MTRKLRTLLCKKWKLICNSAYNNTYNQLITERQYENYMVSETLFQNIDGPAAYNISCRMLVRLDIHFLANKSYLIRDDVFPRGYQLIRGRH